MKNHAVRNGVYLGLTMMLISLIQYIIDPRLMFNFGLGIVLAIVIPIIYMYMAAKAQKADNEGFLSYGESLKTTFVTYMIGSLISMFFAYVLYNFIDPSLLDLQQEVTLEASESMAKMFGADEAALEEMREQMEEQGGSFGPGKALIGWLVSLLFPGIIVALILSAFIKKSPQNT